MNDSREDAKTRSTEWNVEEVSAIVAATFKEGVRRIVNQHQDFASSRLRVNQPGGAS